MKFLSQYKGLPRQTYYLSIVVMIVEIAICCIFPYLSLICNRVLGFTTVQSGYIVSFTSLGNIMGSLLGGKLSDEWGRRRTYIGFAVVMIVAMTIAGFVCRRRIVILLIFLGNAVASAVIPIISAMVIDISPEDKRNESFSLIYIFTNIGSATGPVIAGMLFYNHLPWVYFTMAISYSAALAIVLFKVKETYAGNVLAAHRSGGDGASASLEGGAGENPEDSRKDGKERGGSLLSLMVHSPEMFIFVISLFMIFVSYTEISYVLPLQFTDSVGLEEGSRLTSLIWLINGVLVIVFTPVLMLVIKKHRPLLNVVIGCTLYVVGFLLYSFRLSPAAALAVVAVWTSGEIFIHTEATVYLAELAPLSHRGRVVSLFTFTRGVGKLMGPVLCSYVLTNSGYAAVWRITSGICLLVACVLFLLYRRESGRRRG